MSVGDLGRIELTSDNTAPTTRAVELVGLEDGARCEWIVGKLSACFPFLLFLHYVGPAAEEVPLSVYLGIDGVKSGLGR